MQTSLTNMGEVIVLKMTKVRNDRWPDHGRNPVLRNISLQVAEGEFLTALGESGSGKTTLLRIIAGFEAADSGEVWMEGQRLDALPPHRRRVNTVAEIKFSFE